MLLGPDSMYIQLDAFKGPLELLLQLIEKNEIDIYDIPMAQLTRQYLEAIRSLPPDMDGMSEFLVMAATLLEIKSRMLLPRPKTETMEDEDPREALVRQLIAYKHCQELADILKNTSDAGQRLFKDPEYPLMSKAFSHNPESWLNNITTDHLWNIFKDVMQRQTRRIDTVRQNFGAVPRERHTVANKIRKIAEYLKEKTQVHLSELFAECTTKEECVTTFLALLEMIRQRKAAVHQENIFGEVEILSCQTYS